MKVLLLQAICLSGFLSIDMRASDSEATGSGRPVPREESGVMTCGTVYHIRNDQVVILRSDSREPIRFFHGEGTVYVDESGDPITFKVVTSGTAVTVFYSEVEDQRMANRVIVGEFQPLRNT